MSFGKQKMSFGKQKFDVKRLKMNKFYISRQTVEDEQIYKIFEKWLLVPRMLQLRYPCYTPVQSI